MEKTSKIKYKDFDVTIVGAGFAGLACAMRAASLGLKVCILEKKEDLSQRIHTTGLIVKEAADEWGFPEHLVRKIPGVRLYTPSLKTLDLSSPGYYFLATDTPAFMVWLGESAVKDFGVKIFYNSPWQGATLHDDYILLEKHGIKTKYLIGADGAKSSVARSFNLDQNKKFLFGIENEYKAAPFEDDFLHCFLDSKLAPGYIAWVIPGVNCYQVGLACTKSEEVRMKAFLEKLSERYGFNPDSILEKRRGLIPVGGPLKNISVEDRVILIGDSAGMVSPLTGGGIYTALHYGRLSGDLLYRKISGEGINITRELQKAFPSYFWKKQLRRFMRLHPPNFLYNITLGTPLRGFAQAVYFHSRGIFSKQFWKDVPKSLFRKSRNRK